MAPAPLSPATPERSNDTTKSVSRDLPFRKYEQDKDSQPRAKTKPPFDVVSTYRHLLANDADLTMPVAAIEALVSLLAATPSLTTISETLDLLATAADTLKHSVPNPISLSAGTDLFTRYIVTTLRAGAFPSTSTTASSPANDFAAIRGHLLSNGRLFVARAKDARRAIARIARRFVRDGSTVLTNGGSRVVGAVLQAAAEQQTREGGAPRFRVVYVSGAPAMGDDGLKADGGREGSGIIDALRALHVPVAEISEAAVAYSMGQVSLALVGAEGVVENGGVISRLGTYQLALLARAMGRPMYVVAESHKFVRLFPLGQYDLGVEQKVLDFRTASEVASGASLDKKDAESKKGQPAVQASTTTTTTTQDADDGVTTGGDKTPRGEDRSEYFPSFGGSKSSGSSATLQVQDAVDYTPPDLVTALITEAGVLTPSAVSEELIKIWY